jgi:hypothetical protein
MNLLRRQDGTISRTKGLNLFGLSLALVGAVLPVFQIFIPEIAYSAAMAVWVTLNQHFRNSQSRL